MGGDVRIVYSPLDCLKVARANPTKQVVFFAIGFETTAPANAMLTWRAREEEVKNLSLLVSHVLVPPALEAILQSPENRVRGFLGPGHVCAVMGYSEYDPISAKHNVPIVVTGFEPIDILHGTLMTIRQLEENRSVVENQYSRVLDRVGNLPAQRLIKAVFEVGDRKWRGIGTIPRSGYRLREEFARHDAEKIFNVAAIATLEPKICISGAILRGIKKPHDCPAFGTLCTPEHPLGATMVSAEGACAAYFAYGRHLKLQGEDALHQIVSAVATDSEWMERERA
jgi:hydrogenase expression/formation protein HypD